MKARHYERIEIVKRALRMHDQTGVTDFTGEIGKAPIGACVDQAYREWREAADRLEEIEMSGGEVLR